MENGVADSSTDSNLNPPWPKRSRITPSSLPTGGVEAGLPEKFVLGPTPAMKTRTVETPETSEPSTPSTPTTPTSMRRFFKKATKEDGMDKVLETVNFEEKFSSLPEFKPGGPSLPSSPLIIPGYAKKLREDDLGSDATATPRTPRTPLTCANTPVSSSRLTGTTFFGPDFNPDTFKAGIY